MTDQPARVIPGEISALLDQARGLTRESLARAAPGDRPRQARSLRRGPRSIGHRRYACALGALTRIS